MHTVRRTARPEFQREGLHDAIHALILVPRHARRGAVLFEVIVALTILVIAGLTGAVWVEEVVLAVEHARGAATEVRAASDYLDVIVLWPREDLDRHLGERREGPWRVQVERPVPTIYTIALRDSTGARMILRTAVYRAEVVHATP